MKEQYLLDTNIIIHLLHGKFGIKERIIEVGIKNFYISDITLAELYYGAYNSSSPATALESVNLVSKTFHQLPISGSVLQRYGQEKTILRQKGLLIDDFDILIGTTAIINNMVIVSENIKHLSRLPLKLENWVKR